MEELNLITIPDSQLDSSLSCANEAKRWFSFGFSVIPVLSNSKITAVKWDPWLEELSLNSIFSYWKKNPSHELGFIVGDNVIVLDADSPESITSLINIETAFAVTPNFIVNTKKGVHHYFKLASGAFAKSDSHDTKKHPDRIDVKTGRSMIVLPPSTGKEIEICDAENAADLVEINQDFIDAIFRVNGREEPRAFVPDLKSASPTSTNAKQLKILTDKLDPDIGYDEWYRIGMALYYETGGSEEGLNIYDAWSSKGTKYSGTKEIRAKWSSFKSGSSKPITVGTIHKLLADQNIHYCEDDFIECDYEIIEPSLSERPLDKYSLKGKAAKVEAFAVNAKPILGNIALAGQLTVIYAEFNSGKTLITLHLLIQAISEGIINPLDVYYLNMDDSSSGLLEKVHLADEFGFHMLSEGYEGFTSGKFVEIIRELVMTNKANGTVVILDTLKKFVDLMSKNESSAFAEAMRQYALKGGSLIALAHTNKAKVNGKSKYGGTNDIMSDFDCGYVVEKVSKDNGVNTVEFTKEKGRGCNVSNVSFSFSNDSSLSYCQILASVQEVDPTQLVRLKQVEQQKADEEIIASVRSLIVEGINKKMALAKAVALDSQVSQKTAIGILERYNGKILHWSYSVGSKGANIYSLT